MLFKKYEKRDPAFADIYEHKYGTRSTGVRHPFFFEHIPEKVPELIVPDLTGFELKPYVSYRATLREQVIVILCIQFAKKCKNAQKPVKIQ